MGGLPGLAKGNGSEDILTKIARARRSEFGSVAGTFKLYGTVKVRE
jgi:hypothetical protein